MQSQICEEAIESAIRCGNALLKYISANDVGLTGGHQCGFYLPKSVWKMFVPFGPEKGQNRKQEVRILWQNEIATDSVITWYGKETRSEYRLTKFGKGFPYLAHKMVGNLLVLVRDDVTTFQAFILDQEDDIDEIQTALGVHVFQSWGIYDGGVEVLETEEECVERLFRDFAATLKTFPSGQVFSDTTIQILQECISSYSQIAVDSKLIRNIESEYKLFKLCERGLCQSDVAGVFKNIDDFLRIASSILQRRKSRAGRSLENHFDRILADAGIPHAMRPSKVDGKPDCVIPSEDAYFDMSYPEEKLFVVGIKHTCKDRWRQVLREGRRISHKHILTVQPGISSNQLTEMSDSDVTLIVPKPLHSKYPPANVPSILSVEAFVLRVQSSLIAPTDG